MVTKRALLDSLTKSQLKALADEFGIKSEHSWRKAAFVEALGCSRRINAIGIEELKSRIPAQGSVSQALKSTRQEFFGETAGFVFKTTDEIATTLSNSISVAEIVTPGFITSLNAQVYRLKDSKISQMKEVPNHIWAQLSPKQRGAYGIARSMTHQISRFVDNATKTALNDRRVVEYDSWKRRDLPDRVTYYVCQAYRTHVAGCYDSTIVMLARALEYSLKEVLARKMTVPEKATLGRLVTLYRERIGDDKILEKVLEVANMDRVISAHDIPPYEKQMQCQDANHAWTAFEIVFRELLQKVQS
jgi:HEPN domain-containing protein